MSRRILLILTHFALVPAMFAQSTPVPGSINLLPGFNHETRRGVDSHVGKIWIEGGLSISYDIGVSAGSYVDCQWCEWTKGQLWRKEQTINGETAVAVLTKNKRLVVSFPASHANFYATVRSDSDIVDMLLMLATFRSKAD